MRPVCVKRAGRRKDPASACEGGRLLNGITKLQFRLIAQHSDIYDLRAGVLVAARGYFDIVSAVSIPRYRSTPLTPDNVRKIYDGSLNAISFVSLWQWQFVLHHFYFKYRLKIERHFNYHLFVKIPGSLIKLFSFDIKYRHINTRHCLFLINAFNAIQEKVQAHL